MLFMFRADVGPGEARLQPGTRALPRATRAGSLPGAAGGEGPAQRPAERPRRAPAERLDDSMSLFYKDSPTQKKTRSFWTIT